jgi:hypothetical protein
VQISLRSSARQLRQNKASPQVLLHQAPSLSTIGPGAGLSQDAPSEHLKLGLNAARLEGRNWRDIKEALQDLVEPTAR